MALQRSPFGSLSEHHGARLIQYLILVALVVMAAGGSDWLRASYSQSHSVSHGPTVQSVVQPDSRDAIPIGARHGMASTHIPAAQAVTLRAVSVIASSFGDSGRSKRRLNADRLFDSQSSNRQIRARVHPVTCCCAINSSLARNATLVGAKPSGTG